MNAILSSATKIVLIMFSVTICAGFLLGKMTDTAFIQTATLVLGAYFTAKGVASAVDQKTPTV